MTTISIADPLGSVDVETAKKPYMELNEPTEIMPRSFKLIKEGMSAQFWNYKAHYSAMAHIKTPGYKRYKFTAYMENDTDIIPLQFIDWHKERPIITDRPLDVYVSGNFNFFLLEPSNDVELYTFDGRFFRNSDGILASIAHRLPIMGVDGYIYINTDSPEIDEFGNVFEDNEFKGQLKIVSFKSNHGLWTIDGTVFYQREPEKVVYADDPEFSVIQGYYEAQNEPPGMMTTKTIAPFAEATAKSAKKLLETYDTMFKAVID